MAHTHTACAYFIINIAYIFSISSSLYDPVLIKSTGFKQYVCLVCVVCIYICNIWAQVFVVCISLISVCCFLLHIFYLCALRVACAVIAAFCAKPILQNAAMKDAVQQEVGGNKLRMHNGKQTNLRQINLVDWSSECQWLRVTMHQ